MGDRIHTLAQQLTGKATLEECGLDELQVIAQRYPYFAPAQFLLLQKLRQMGSEEEAERQYRKAVLFYHDPLLFEHFISSNRFYVDEIMTNGSSQEPVSQLDIPHFEEHNFSHLEQYSEETGSPTGDPIDLVDVDANEHAFIDNTLDSQSTAESHDEAIVASQSEVPLEAEISAKSHPAELHEEAIEEGKLSNSIKEPSLPKWEAEPAQPEADLSFEPFHTVDYFASQGIKISQEELPKDKLGKQLKSFTEWLKTMKRLPATQITETLESSVESKVETMASYSVTESDVVTEAMAEVWAKQGNTEKALDIYNKLSLLNPSKKAYFAAKIENLKQS
jgi:tetratricopeptide (TPR) repeat protein